MVAWTEHLRDEKSVKYMSLLRVLLIFATCWVQRGLVGMSSGVHLRRKAINEKWSSQAIHAIGGKTMEGIPLAPPKLWHRQY